ncbi:hypothetical protein [Agrococcus baldri]|nr:hypothetical protein [Agrococcus baldri]
MTFTDALLADGPATASAELDLYGRFVGRWAVRNRFRSGPDAPWIESERVWEFAWILGGRAIQDVLVGSDRGDEPVPAGCTVRVFDAALGAWRIEWFGALNGDFSSQIGRGDGPDRIVQEGVEHAVVGELPSRWTFSAITPDSFVWDGELSRDGGATWYVEQHMDCTRIV